MSAVLGVTLLPFHFFSFALIFPCFSVLYPHVWHVLCPATPQFARIAVFRLSRLATSTPPHSLSSVLIHTARHTSGVPLRPTSSTVMTSCPAQSVPWVSCVPLHPHSLRVPLPPPSLHRWCLPPPLSLSRWILPALSRSPNTADISRASPRTPIPQQRTSVGMAWAWGRAAPARTRPAAAPLIASAAPGRTSLRPRWPAPGCISSRQRRVTVTTVVPWVAWLERWGFTEGWVGRESPQKDAGKPRCPFGDTTRQRGTGSGTGPFPWSEARTHTATRTDAPTSSAARVYPETGTQCLENSSTLPLIWRRGVKTRRQKDRQIYLRQKMVRKSDCLKISPWKHILQ